jgi:hypothetical protein
MGANVYLKAVSALGYKTATAATAIMQYIQPRSGSRIAIRAFGMSCGATATTVYWMVPIGQSSITTAVASGATTGFAVDAQPQTTANALASADNVAIQLDDGTYQFTTVATGLFTGFSIAAALTDTVAAGNTVYAFGIFSDTGHFPFKLTISTQTTAAVDGGVFYANAKGAPMIVYHANDAAAAGSQDYVAIDYLDK